MNHSILPWALAVAVALGGAGTYVWLQRPAEEPVAPVQSAEAETEEEAELALAAAEPLERPAEQIPIEPREPVGIEIPEPVPQEPQEPEEPPLPELDRSDDEVQAALARLIGSATTDRFLSGENLVRHLVVTIDNLARDHVAERQRPVRPVPGRFQASDAGDDDPLEEEPIYLEPENYPRYEPLVRAIDELDVTALAQTYQRLYPLFREAYMDLGHPSGNFNHRLVEVIDHLLETPAVNGPIELVRPNVLYEFADEELEALSPGQKALLRMGPDNAAVVKARLRELRAELI